MRLPWPLPDSSFRRFRLLNSYAAAKKVSAAPHRGEANRPITMQGKATTTRQQPNRQITMQGKATTTRQQPKWAVGKTKKSKPKTKRRHAEQNRVASN